MISFLEREWIYTEAVHWRACYKGSCLRGFASCFREREKRVERRKTVHPWKCYHVKPLLCERSAFLMHWVSRLWTTKLLSSATGEITCQAVLRGFRMVSLKTAARAGGGRQGLGARGAHSRKLLAAWLGGSCRAVSGGCDLTAACERRQAEERRSTLQVCVCARPGRESEPPSQTQSPVA